MFKGAIFVGDLFIKGSPWQLLSTLYLFNLMKKTTTRPSCLLPVPWLNQFPNSGKYYQLCHQDITFFSCHYMASSGTSNVCLFCPVCLSFVIYQEMPRVVAGPPVLHFTHCRYTITVLCCTVSTPHCTLLSTTVYMLHAVHKYGKSSDRFQWLVLNHFFPTLSANEMTPNSEFDLMCNCAVQRITEKCNLDWFVPICIPDTK
jgi:hypothetical protein